MSAHGDPPVPLPAAAGGMLRAGRPVLWLQADRLMAQVVAALRAGPSGNDPPLAGAAAALAELAGALALVGEPGWSALANRLRRRIIAADERDGDSDSDGAASLPALAAMLRSVLQLAFERSLRGRPLVAADLLPAWQALAAAGNARSARGDNPAEQLDHAAPLVSLQPDEDAEPALPLAADGDLPDDPPHDPLHDTERAALAFLRAAGAAERRQAACRLAPVLARVAAHASSGTAGRCWRVLHAYLLELAEGSCVGAAQAKSLLVHLLRALRHRADPGLPVMLEPLARQALFALAQVPALTDAGRHIASAFRLAEQFSPTPGIDTAWTTNPASPADERFIEQLGRWIAAREAGNDGLGPAEDWLCLADAAGKSDRFRPVAASLSRVGTRSPGLAAHGAAQSVAAAMLCLHAWAGATPGVAADGERIAGLLEQAADDARAAQPALQALAFRLEHQALLHALSGACGEVLDVGERLLDDLGGKVDYAPGWADACRLLQALAGAARLLGLHGVLPLVDALLAQAEALDATGLEAGAGGLRALALTWAMLADETALLPWTTEWPDLATGEGCERDSPDALPAAACGPPAAEGTAAAADPLVAIFLSEAAGLLAQLRAALQPAHPLLPAAPLSDAPLSDALHAAHTLAGCAATVGLPGMSRLALALERLLERLHEPLQERLQGGLQGGLQEGLTECLSGHPAAAVLQDTGGAAIAETLQMFDAMLAEFADTGTCGEADALAERLAACRFDAGEAMVRPADPGSCAGPDRDNDNDPDNDNDNDNDPDSDNDNDNNPDSGSDDELLAIFREEAADLLPRLQQAVDAWLQAPDDRTVPASLLRVLHMLKGSARMAGQLAWGEDLHRCESEVAAIAQLAPEATRVRVDALQAQIDGWRRAWCGQPACLPVGAPERCSPSPFEPARAVPASPVPLARAPAALPARAASSLLRVRAETFATFADSVAELWIGHARLTDGVQQQRRAVTELADSVGRLRAQVRELEIDAESRIVSGAASADDKGFDPLEFDRYTRLHEMTRMIAESAADLADLQRGLARQGDGLARAGDAQARELRCLQSNLQAVRSQPFGAIESRLRHVLRQAARESGREVELQLSGASAEVDRPLLDRLAGPLEHVLRNAVVHGIEPPAEREALGKPRTGRVVLAVLPSAAELRLEIADDGRGLDVERLRARASAVGLPAGEADPADPADPEPTALHELIFQPGFSTASEVTALAGRGIGLDAVRSELQSLGGRISVDSRPGEGCRFLLCVPLSLATLPVLLVRAGRHRIGLLAPTLRQLLQQKPGDPGYDSGSRALRWQGADVPLADLGHLLGEASPPLPVGARQPVAVLRDSDRLLALKLDAVDGQRELVVKHAGPQLSRVPGMIGASVLGDGSIALIVDPFRLERRAEPGVAVAAGSEGGPLVLVVDDSLTVRRASQRLLERHGYQVALARDGLEALPLLRERRPAAVLLDIEMPRMDGFELLAAVRDDPQLRELPVVMVSSRIADRHRQRAYQLGASGYMGKPCREEELLGLLAGLCRSGAGGQHEGRLEKQPEPHGAEAAA